MESVLQGEQLTSLIGHNFEIIEYALHNSKGSIILKNLRY